jgi:WD40 repeat protein
MSALNSKPRYDLIALLCAMVFVIARPARMCSAAPAASQPAPETQPATKPQWSARIVAQLHGSSGQFVAFSRDQAAILTGGKDQVRVWDAKTFQPRIEPIKCPSFLRTTGFLDGAKKVFTVAGKSARVWDAVGGRELLTLTTEADMLSAGASPDSKWLVTGGDDGMARIWELNTGRQSLEKKHPGKVSYAGFSAKGGFAVTVAKGKIAPTFAVTAAMYLWNPQTGQDVVHWQAVSWPSDPDDHLVPVAISRDETKAAMADWDTVGVLNVATDDALANLATAGEHNAEFIHSLTFSPDGKKLVTCGAMGAQLWNSEREEKPALIGDGAMRGQAAFSPDGAVVLVSSEDEVAAYNVASGEQLLSVHSARAETNGFPVLAFSPDGRYFAVGFAHSDLTIVWELNSP